MRTLTRRDLLARAAGAAAAACSAGAALGQDAGVQGAGTMVLIAGGPFRMGSTETHIADLARTCGYHPSWFEGESPERLVDAPDFLIDRYPVTHREYAAFCHAAGHAPPTVWSGPEPPDRWLDCPVVGVSLADAFSFAAWAGKRIPTEAEWEKAARGADGRIWPWGDSFEPDACHFNRDRAPSVVDLRPVDAHPLGESPYGVMDMIGNAAEWCADGPGPGAAYIKGGCWMNEEIVNLRPAARNMSGFANNPLPFYGFRCAKDV